MTWTHGTQPNTFIWDRRAISDFVKLWIDSYRKPSSATTLLKSFTNILKRRKSLNSSIRNVESWILVNCGFECFRRFIWGWTKKTTCWSLARRMCTRRVPWRCCAGTRSARGSTWAKLSRCWMLQPSTPSLIQVLTSLRSLLAAWIWNHTQEWLISAGEISSLSALNNSVINGWMKTLTALCSGPQKSWPLLPKISYGSRYHFCGPLY